MAASPQDFDGADEGDFLELLIANERVLEWADELQTPGGSAARKKDIVFQLRDAVDSKPSYAEEARRAGLAPILTQLLSRTNDEEVMDAVSQIMVALSGPMASGGKTRDYTYGPVTVRIREGALGDGLGAKVWTVAHLLCKELVQHPGFVQGHCVLEIGAGCGVCGVVAAKLGADKIILTDVEGPVLRNLRECVTLNASHTDTALAALRFCAPTTPTTSTTTAPQGTLPQAAGTGTESTQGRSQGQSQGMGVGESQGQVPQMGMQGTRVGENLSGAQDKSQHQQGNGVGESSVSEVPSVSSSWDVGGMSVRYLDWLESLRAMQSGQPIHAASTGPSSQQQATASSVTSTSTSQPLSPTAQATSPNTSQAEGAGNGVGGHEGSHGNGVGGDQEVHGDAAHTGPVLNTDDAKQFYAGDLLRMSDDCHPPGDMPPSIPISDRFDRIIGTDVMYEPMHAALVAAVIAHRLARGGAALLCCAVRQARTFAAFEKECVRWGLRYRKRQVEPATEYGGILGRTEDYEGGFLLMAVDHVSAPCTSWHRDDWQTHCVS